MNVLGIIGMSLFALGICGAIVLSWIRKNKTSAILTTVVGILILCVIIGMTVTFFI